MYCPAPAAKEFLVVQKKVSDLLKGRILVGHALHNDLKVRFHCRFYNMQAVHGYMLLNYGLI